MVNIIAMSPDEYKSKSSSNFTIYFGRHETPFGECLVGITQSEKAICFLWFVDDNFDDCLEILKKEWPQASLVESRTETAKVVEDIFSDAEDKDLCVLLRGTDFQIKVWRALMKIPRGEITTYSKIAEEIGHAKGIRAAGTAMKTNRIAYLVPCHRVASKTGENKYRWGPSRRERILEFERKGSRR